MPRTSTSTTTRSRTSSTPRKAPARARRRTDALTLLQEDHKRVQKMFKQFEKMDREDTGAMQELVRSACEALDIHAKVEEELFYPALRDAVDEDKAHALDEAEVEHDSAKQLIAQLRELQPDDPRYAATFTVLGEYVNHHISEEEGEIFKLAKRAKVDVQEVGEAIEQRKQQLQGDGDGKAAAPREIAVKEMDIEDEEDMEPGDGRVGRRR